MMRATGHRLRHLVRPCRQGAGPHCAPLGVAGGSLVYTLAALTFETSSLRLLPPGQPYVQRYAEWLDEFEELNDIVVVEAPDPAEARAYADRLAEALWQGPVRIPRATYQSRPRAARGPPAICERR